jgi:hypothetical protein
MGAITERERESKEAQRGDTERELAFSDAQV